MATIVDDLATYLAAYSPSLSLTVGTNLFRFGLVSEPDEQVALIPYGGTEPEGSFGKDGIRWEHARIQVVCRGEPNDQRTPITTANAIYLALGNIDAETLSGTLYHHAWPLQGANHMGSDANGRPMIGFNVDVVRDLGA